MNEQIIREACDDIEHAVTLGNVGFIGKVSEAVAKIRGALTDEPIVKVSDGNGFFPITARK
jgi:hypothetical protein